MNLKNISNQELCLRMEKLVRSERKITHLILMHILEIESRRLYADLGYDGIFSYLTKGLGYSESAAYRRLQSSRVLMHVPAIAEKLEDGSLNLSQLTQVQKCLKDESKSSARVYSTEKTQALLERIENKSAFETEKLLAIEFNRPIQSFELVKPQKDSSIRLEVTFSKEQYEELQRARDLLSHVCPEGSWAEVLTVIAKKFNQTKLGKNVTQSFAAKQVEILESDLSGVVEEDIDAGNIKMSKSTNDCVNKRKYLSVKKRRTLLMRAKGCCEYRDPKSGKACNSTYQLQVDHVFPLSLGGSDNSTNLRILCRTHNLYMATKYGLSDGRKKSTEF